jgi:hypothetical protein
MLNTKNLLIQKNRLMNEVTNPMRKIKNSLMILPNIMRTWLKSERRKISNMMMRC